MHSAPFHVYKQAIGITNYTVVKKNKEDETFQFYTKHIFQYFTYSNNEPSSYHVFITP